MQTLFGRYFAPTFLCLMAIVLSLHVLLRVLRVFATSRVALYQLKKIGSTEEAPQVCIVVLVEYVIFVDSPSSKTTTLLVYY